MGVSTSTHVGSYALSYACVIFLGSEMGRTWARRLAHVVDAYD